MAKSHTSGPAIRRDSYALSKQLTQGEQQRHRKTVTLGSGITTNRDYCC